MRFGEGIVMFGAFNSLANLSQRSCVVAKMERRRTIVFTRFYHFRLPHRMRQASGLSSRSALAAPSEPGLRADGGAVKAVGWGFLTDPRDICECTDKSVHFGM